MTMPDRFDMAVQQNEAHMNEAGRKETKLKLVLQHKTTLITGSTSNSLGCSTVCTPHFFYIGVAMGLGLEHVEATPAARPAEC